MKADGPHAATVEVEIDASIDEQELLDRAADDGLAPTESDLLHRYLIYLGAGYLRGERERRRAGSTSEGLGRLRRLHGAAGGTRSVLLFEWSEASRRHAAERRAEAAHTANASAMEGLVRRAEQEIAIRAERIANLEERLECA